MADKKKTLPFIYIFGRHYTHRVWLVRTNNFLGAFSNLNHLYFKYRQTQDTPHQCHPSCDFAKDLRAKQLKL